MSDQEEKQELIDRTNGIADGLDTLLILFGVVLVFIMHGGFAMLSAGAIRSQSTMNILMHTVLDAVVSCIMMYTVGFGFAFGIGANPNRFIGDALFGLARYTSHFTGSGIGRWIDFVFQWAFCATAATIPAGAVAERCSMIAYLSYTVLISGFVYPVVAHWVWCVTGWLGYASTLPPLFGAGFVDFAGSAVIHMTGGLTGFIGAAMLGPRRGRFDSSGKPINMPGQSPALVVLGTVLLWFGWYGFNTASNLTISSSTSAQVVGRVAVTTTLAGGAGGVACLFHSFISTRGRTWNLFSLCNGVLCGFVAITACCHVVEPWAAVICGACAGLFFDLISEIVLNVCRVDDPLSAFSMHYGAGLFGIIFTGLFAKPEYLGQVYGARNGGITNAYGAFYAGSSGNLFWSQVIGALTITVWVGGIMSILFGILKMLGVLRISMDEETIGMDCSKHGGVALNGAVLGAMTPVAVMPTTAAGNNSGVLEVAMTGSVSGVVSGVVSNASVASGPV